MEGFRKQGEKHAQDGLGATDDEWKVIVPKLEKVQAILTQLNASRGGIVIAATHPVEESEVAKRSKALVAALHNKDAKPQDLADALKACREARSKAQEEFEKARKALKEILTARQEATLVTTGVLE